MDGYSSYLASLPAKPDYTREVMYKLPRPLYSYLASIGVDVDSESRHTKILCNLDSFAASYRTNSGGVMEVKIEPDNGVYVFIEISASDIKAYNDYIVPLPLWAYLAG